MTVLKIKDLLANPKVPESQRAHIAERVRLGLASQSPLDSALRDLWVVYDAGGISGGRSMRSLLLDEARALIDHGCYDEAGAFIGYLISMYFNAEYINANGWYDFRVDEITLPLSERILLLIAAESLKIKTVPNVVWLNAEYLFERLREASKMRLVAHFERFENFEF